MAKRVAEYLFTGSTTSYSVSGVGYNSAVTNMGNLIQQFTGITPTDNWAGPLPVSVGRPMEASTAIPVMYPMAIRWSSTLDWVFFIENSTAASASRRIVLYTYNRTNGAFTWIGFITATLPTATAHTIRGFRVTYDTYSTGTVGTGGTPSTTITGTGTLWVDNRISVGSRIGFGSTNPTEISASNWFIISAVSANGTITITNPATVANGTSYVIEELRTIIVTTNATAGNGGMFIVKGLNYSDFTVGGTTISAATTTDKLKACYWMRDAATLSNTAACGLAMEPKSSLSTQLVYIIDGTASPKVYKYNIRDSLTGLSSGGTSAGFWFATGTQLATGTLSQVNNGRFGSVNHGPWATSAGLWFATTTRIYFALTGNITAGNNSWFSGSMVEIPPSGTATIQAGSVMNSVEISDSIDRLVVMTTGAGGVRSYITQFNTSSNPFDHIFLNDDKQLDQSTGSTGTPLHASIQASTFSVWAEGGILYLARNQTTANQNQIYTIPIGAHWTYAGATGNLQRLITAEILTPNCNKYYRVYVNSAKYIGDDTLGLQPEPFKTYYRTAGISDDTGSWTLINNAGDISGVAGASSIQFMFEFKTIGTYCIPARIYGISVIYEDQTTDSHFQPSVGQSSTTNKIFAWRFSTAFGSTVPTLYIKLYDAVTNGVLLTDDTVSSSSGIWEKSTDGGINWTTTGLTADKTNNTTYIRYTPTTLGDNIRVRALLTQ
jgi:hypothetical protein